jgi:hypothetical protein
MPLVFCSFCPKSYHEGCLPKGTAITSPRWYVFIISDSFLFRVKTDVGNPNEI